MGDSTRPFYYVNTGALQRVPGQVPRLHDQARSVGTGTVHGEAPLKVNKPTTRWVTYEQARRGEPIRKAEQVTDGLGLSPLEQQRLLREMQMSLRQARNEIDFRKSVMGYMRGQAYPGPLRNVLLTRAVAYFHTQRSSVRATQDYRRTFVAQTAVTGRSLAPPVLRKSATHGNVGLGALRYVLDTEWLYKSVTTAKVGGTWEGLKIIAIGPRGGRIVGYLASGRPIYAGSSSARALKRRRDGESGKANKPTATKRNAASKKTASKKTASKKTASKKTAAKKTAAKKTAAKKVAAKKVAAKKVAAKKSAAKKPVTKKTATAKVTGKKTATKKAVVAKRDQRARQLPSTPKLYGLLTNGVPDPGRHTTNLDWMENARKRLFHAPAKWGLPDTPFDAGKVRKAMAELQNRSTRSRGLRAIREELHRLAAEYGLYSTDHQMMARLDVTSHTSAGGEHHWSGEIGLSGDALNSLDSLAADITAGRASDALSGISVFIHEVIHGTWPFTNNGLYSGIGMALEELTTETSSHPITRDFMRRMGVADEKIDVADDASSGRCSYSSIHKKFADAARQVVGQYVDLSSDPVFATKVGAMLSTAGSTGSSRLLRDILERAAIGYKQSISHGERFANHDEALQAYSKSLHTATIAALRDRGMTEPGFTREAALLRGNFGSGVPAAVRKDMTPARIEGDGQRVYLVKDATTRQQVMDTLNAQETAEDRGRWASFGPVQQVMGAARTAEAVGGTFRDAQLPAPRFLRDFDARIRGPGAEYELKDRWVREVHRVGGGTIEDMRRAWRLMCQPELAKAADRIMTRKKTELDRTIHTTATLEHHLRKNGFTGMSVRVRPPGAKAASGKKSWGSRPISELTANQFLESIKAQHIQDRKG